MRHRITVRAPRESKNEIARFRALKTQNLAIPKPPTDQKTTRHQPLRRCSRTTVYGVQPARLANPGIAAYQAPAAVRALYPQQRTSFFEGAIVPVGVAAVEASGLEHTLATTVRRTTRPERKVGSEASDHRKSSKRTASRTRERQRQVILTHNPERGLVTISSAI
jgi:hypothetical protein